MKDLLFNQLIRRSMTSPDHLTRLNLSELWTLLNIYNKRYVEYMVEYSRHFDLYENDFHGRYTFLFKELGKNKDASALNAVEKNTIFSQTSSLLFHDEVIEKKEVESFLNLVDHGFFSFFPQDHGLSFAEKFYDVNDGHIIRKNFDDYFFRSDLNYCPIFIHIPSKVDISAKMVNLHFKIKTPKYYAFITAIENANKESQSIKGLNDVFSSLILLDNILIFFIDIFKKGIANFLDERFLEFLDVIDIRDLLDRSSYADQQQILMRSRINLIIGWIFNCNLLNRSDRLEFIKLLSSGRSAAQDVIKYAQKFDLEFQL